MERKRKEWKGKERNQSIRFIFHSMYNNDKEDAMLGTDRETSRGRTALSFRVPEKVLSAII